MDSLQATLCIIKGCHIEYNRSACQTPKMRPDETQWKRWKGGINEFFLKISVSSDALGLEKQKQWWNVGAFASCTNAKDTQTVRSEEAVNRSHSSATPPPIDCRAGQRHVIGRLWPLRMCNKRPVYKTKTNEVNWSFITHCKVLSRKSIVKKFNASHMSHHKIKEWIKKLIKNWKLHSGQVADASPVWPEFKPRTYHKELTPSNCNPGWNHLMQVRQWDFNWQKN